MFVGRGDLKKNRIKNLFRVRRQAVHNALLWLKTHNQKYYGNINISDDHLSLLPEDDVPDVLMHLVRRCDDEGIIDQENDNYVQDDNDIQNESESYCFLYDYVILPFYFHQPSKPVKNLSQMTVTVFTFSYFFCMYNKL